MKGPQAIILMMLAALILWLTWSKNSPLHGAASTSATPVAPSTNKTGDIVPTNKPSDTNTTDSFPAIPSKILDPYDTCIKLGGDWDYTQNICSFKG